MRLAQQSLARHAMRMLVSVRDVPEARLAAAGGADFIDLKEPSNGALGGLPLATVSAIVQALREQGCRLPISATIGDLPMTGLDAIVARAQAVAACGVDYVKVGIERQLGASAVLDALADTGLAVVPVFIGDSGLDFDHVAQACQLKFPGLMVDTADKRAGSLFERMPPAQLQRFVALARGSAAMVGLAGALQRVHLLQLQALGPDFAGFRSAVCAGDRSGTLDADRLRSLAAALHTGSG